MKNTSPLVSCVMPAYNAARYLDQAVKSVQNQSFSEIEIIIIDDGSTDNTWDILQKLANDDRRIRIYHQENQGFAITCNRAIELAIGEYIAHLDSDDLMDRDKVLLQLEFLNNNPHFDLVHTAIQVIDETGNPLMVQRGENVDPDTFLAKMLFRSIMPNPTTIFGKKANLALCPYLEQYKRSVDYDRALRLAEHFKFGYIDKPLTLWRRHDKNLTNQLHLYRLEQKQILQSWGKKKLLDSVDKSPLLPDEKTLLKGNILYNIELFSDAAEILKKLNTPQGHFYLANAYLKLGDADRAIENYQKCLDKEPNHPACWNNLGVARFEKGLEADSYFQKALALKPGYLDPMINLSRKDKQITDRELRNQLIPYKLE